MYYNGQGVEQDYDRSAKIYAKACNGSDINGCHNLGGIYYNGKGVKQNRTRARALITKACKGGNQNACANLKIIQ